MIVIAGPSLVFGAEWYDFDWDYSIKGTIDSTQVPSTLTDYPVLIEITNSDLGMNAQSDCDDILFTDVTNSTKYSHEIEECDLTANDTITAWLKIPSLSSSSDTNVFMYYGNGGAANQENVSDVWSADYEGVWHLHDDFLDSTNNGNDGTNTGSSTVEISGTIADGQDFDNVNDDIDFGTSLSLDDVFATGGTFQTIFNIDNVGTAETLLWTRGNGGLDGIVLLIHNLLGGTADVRIVSDTSATLGRWEGANLITPDTSYVSAMTFDSDNINNLPEFWIDGSKKSVGSGLTEAVNPTGAFSDDSGLNKMIGNSEDNTRDLDGMMDEVRFSSIIRSDDWLTTDYNNMKDGSTFVSYGSQDQQPSNVTANISDGILSGDTGVTASLTIETNVNDGSIIGDSVVIVVTGLSSINVSDGIIFGGNNVLSDLTIVKVISDGVIAGDSVQPVIFGDIPVSISDGILLGDSASIVIGCDVTCSRIVTDGIVVGDSQLTADVAITTYNSIKLYLNTPTLSRLGGVFSQSCNVGDYVSGIDTTGAIICTALP